MNPEIPKATHHQVGVLPSTMLQILWVIQAKSRLFSTKVLRGISVGWTWSRTAWGVLSIDSDGIIVLSDNINGVLPSVPDVPRIQHG